MGRTLFLLLRRSMAPLYSRKVHSALMSCLCLRCADGVHAASAVQRPASTALAMNGHEIYVGPDLAGVLSGLSKPLKVVVRIASVQHGRALRA